MKSSKISIGLLFRSSLQIVFVMKTGKQPNSVFFFVYCIKECIWKYIQYNGPDIFIANSKMWIHR